MIRWLSLFAVVAVGCASPKPEVRAPTKVEPAAIDAPKVVLTLPTFPDGKDHDVSTDLGHVVVLDVWATWCPPCRETLPVYQSLYERYKDRGLRVYAISTDENHEDLKDFIREYQLTLPVLTDPDGVVVEKALEVRVMPTTLLVDREGRIRQVYRGADDTGIEEQVQQLLAEGT